jgi:hypothetical protein
MIMTQQVCCHQHCGKHGAAAVLPPPLGSLRSAEIQPAYKLNRHAHQRTAIRTQNTGCKGSNADTYARSYAAAVKQ